MKNSRNKLSLSYAQAIYEAASSAKEEEKILSDVDALNKAIEADSHIMTMLSNPLWQSSAKKDALEEIGNKLKLNKITVNALLTMAENNRLNLLPHICEEYRKIYYKANNIAEVLVKSVIELTTEQDNHLKKALEKWLSKKVVIKYKIEPEIIGGLLIECNSTQFDDSIKGKLEKLKNVMKGNN